MKNLLSWNFFPENTPGGNLNVNCSCNERQGELMDPERDTIQEENIQIDELVLMKAIAKKLIMFIIFAEGIMKFYITWIQYKYQA